MIFLTKQNSKKFVLRIVCIINVKLFNMHNKNRILIGTWITAKMLRDKRHAVFQRRGIIDTYGYFQRFKTVTKYLSASLSNLPISITMFLYHTHGKSFRRV